MIQPVASYRVQLTPERGFEAVRRSLRRLQALGISHLYLSPVTEAVPGSTHGYDVVDHARVRDELGGLDGLTALLDDLAARGMAAIVDHVANHASIERPELNRQWWALLRDGRGCAADRWFDVDWDAAGGQVLLPVLDAPLEEQEVRVDTVDGVATLRVGALRFPLAASTEELPPRQALERQHYRPIHWRSPQRNVRRFFAIDQLVAVRVEHSEVAAVVDTVPRLLLGHEAFDGVRVDHVDGLADPTGYLRRLRQLLGDRWLIVEKVLAPGEHLPASWPVDGTTGYEHALLLEHSLLDPAGWAQLASTWRRVTGDGRPFREWELQARREVLNAGLGPDRDRVGRLARSVGGAVAVSRLSAHLRRYRTYLPDDPDGLHALAEAAAESGASELASAIATRPELRTRWQQLTGPATAKGVEDRAFWRYMPLASLGEVGGDPEAEPGAIDRLHAEHAITQASWPTMMLAGTTHDVKRTEDVRAFGLALANDSTAWVRVVDEWLAQRDFPDLDVATQWLALQTVATTPELSAERLETFLVKAAREADLHTSWTDPAADYEQRLGALARDLVAWPPIVELAASLQWSGRATTLAMLAVRCLAPGVPDVYQGTEAFRFLLVDPDNRTPPDEEELDALVAENDDDDDGALDGPAARAVVLRRLLALRRRWPEVFGRNGGYQRLDVDDVDDVDREGVIAFARLDPGGEPRVVVVVGRHQGSPSSVDLPAGQWRTVLEVGRAIVLSR